MSLWGSVFGHHVLFSITQPEDSGQTVNLQAKPQGYQTPSFIRFTWHP
jgi:hypothetical protein